MISVPRGLKYLNTVDIDAERNAFDQAPIVLKHAPTLSAQMRAHIHTHTHGRLEKVQFSFLDSNGSGEDRSCIPERSADIQRLNEHAHINRLVGILFKGNRLLQEVQLLC